MILRTGAPFSQPVTGLLAVKIAEISLLPRKLLIVKATIIREIWAKSDVKR